MVFHRPGSLFDALILCRFFRDFLLWDELQELIAATSGRQLSHQEMEALAGETTRLTRTFNRREALDESSDTLPQPFFKSTREGAVISRGEIALMLKEYNQLRNEAAD